MASGTLRRALIWVQEFLFSRHSGTRVERQILRELLAAVSFLVVLTVGTVYATPISFRGCFASGPGTGSASWDRDVDTITGALIGTGSWNASRAMKLKQGSRVAIETCVETAKLVSKPGDEFVFYFSGHGGDALFPDATEAGEGGADPAEPSDNHILIGNTAGGAADRITDDQLATLLSGFRSSVTISVVLDSCRSHTFFDGANDLGSVTQSNGGPVAAGDHLALAAASSPATPTCGGGFTDKFAEGLMFLRGRLRADMNGDGTVTTEEAGIYAGAYISTAGPKCDGENCPVPIEGLSDYVGPVGCGPVDEVCPTVAEVIPEPATLLLLGSGLIGIGWRCLRQKRLAQRNPGECHSSCSGTRLHL